MKISSDEKVELSVAVATDLLARLPKEDRTPQVERLALSIAAELLILYQMIYEIKLQDR